MDACIAGNRIDGEEAERGSQGVRYELNKLLKPGLEGRGCVYRLNSVSVSLISEPTRRPPHERMDALPPASGGGMMMMAQKSPIRASRPRIITYDPHEDAFEADMLTDGADGVDVLYIKLLNFRDQYCVHIPCNMRQHSGEDCFVFIGHVGFVNEERKFVEVEAKTGG